MVLADEGKIHIFDIPHADDQNDFYTYYSVRIAVVEGAQL